MIIVKVGTATVELQSDDTTVGASVGQPRTSQKYVVDDLLHAVMRALYAVNHESTPRAMGMLDDLRTEMLRHV